MIIVENACVDWPVGKVSPAVLTIHDDRFIAGLGDLIEEVYVYGVKTTVVQLVHTNACATLRDYIKNCAKKNLRALTPA